MERSGKSLFGGRCAAISLRNSSTEPCNTCYLRVEYNITGNLSD